MEFLMPVMEMLWLYFSLETLLESSGSRLCFLRRLFPGMSNFMKLPAEPGVSHNEIKSPKKWRDKFWFFHSLGMSYCRLESAAPR